MRHADEDVGLRRGEHRFERLHRSPSGLSGMERRPAARVDDPCAGRQPPVGRDLPQPLRLGEHGAAHLAHRCVYSIAAMAEFPWTHRERVRFRDCDPMGHVNNAAYSTYLEQARIAVLGGLEPFILARVEIDFRSELRSGEEIEVRTRCPRIGTRSFDLEHELWAGGRLAAEAKSVLVGYDYGTGSSVPLSDDLRRKLAA